MSRSGNRTEYVVIFDDSADESGEPSVDGPFPTEESAQDHIDSESFRFGGVIVPFKSMSGRIERSKPKLKLSELRRAAGTLNYQVCRNVIDGLGLADIIDDGDADD